jgi:hypothetical protein
MVSDMNSPSQLQLGFEFKTPHRRLVKMHFNVIYYINS